MAPIAPWNPASFFNSSLTAGITIAAVRASVSVQSWKTRLKKIPLNYIGNAVAYGYIIYKSDSFYIYSGTLPDRTMYTVEVDIDAVPPSHHDQDVEATKKLPTILTETIQEGPALDLSDAMPESDHSTDEELWAGFRSQAEKSPNLGASTKLLEVIKDH
ncbi:hypothetical protein OUZ56_010465 [Daphnia magna]|uniref:Uncharacterized protein n=1 Tax=Daphnia magna TaxID=35525 RepID=A0ABR0AIN3_9CRUS|nr:hypothetical protein OUZ56_010465 [Daphnia magna]